MATTLRHSLESRYENLPRSPHQMGSAAHTEVFSYTKWNASPGWNSNPPSIICISTVWNARSHLQTSSRIKSRFTSGMTGHWNVLSEEEKKKNQIPKLEHRKLKSSFSSSSRWSETVMLLHARAFSPALYAKRYTAARWLRLTQYLPCAVFSMGGRPFLSLRRFMASSACSAAALSLPRPGLRQSH